MSDQKYNSNGDTPKDNKMPAVKGHEKKAEHFPLDLDDQKVDADLKMESNEIRSHSDGKSGPVSPEGKPASAPKKESGAGMKNPKEQLKEHKKRSRKKGRKNAWFFRGIWIGVIVLVGVGIAQFAISCLNDMLGFQKQSSQVTIELSKDATVDQVADILKDNGLINNKWAFTTYSKFTNSDGNYEYGTFQLTVGMDYQALINSLQASGNRVDTTTITFQEGMQVTEMAKKLEENGVCTADEFIKAVNNKDLWQSYEFISDIDNMEERAYYLEGYLFPDTYDFYKNEGAENAIEKMLNNTKNKLTSDLYKKVEKSGMSMDEIITLASMIQAEAASKKDMYNVSSVFHNRLEAGAGSSFAYLNSDPTIWYPYESQKDMPEGYQGAYNTYTHPGLPLGPICNPGMSAIEAALDPADTNYYYFCHAKDGTPYYAETEWEHNNNLVTAGLA